MVSAKNTDLVARQCYSLTPLQNFASVETTDLSFCQRKTLTYLFVCAHSMGANKRGQQKTLTLFQGKQTWSAKNTDIVSVSEFFADN